MKHILKLLFLTACLGFIYNSCNKLANLPDKGYYNGNAPTLTASVTAIMPKAADSSNVILTLNWSNPKYATDSAHQKFIIEMDSTGRNFSHEVSFEADGPLNYAFTGNTLNTMLANFGFVAGQPFKVDIRVTASYANNNEQLNSNTITVTMTPYLVPIVLTPSATSQVTLQIANGSQTALSFSWNASSYGSSTINYALQFDTVGGKFANPQVFQYGTALNAALVTNSLNTAIINSGVLGGATKNMEFRVVSYLGSNYTSPLVYSDTINLSIATYVPVPANLYIVGDATPGGWANPVPVPSQQFTQTGLYTFSINIGLTAGKSYLFLPLNGDWTHKYGGASAAGGPLLADNAVPSSNTPAPATTGVYNIVVNFQTNIYTVTQVPVPSNLYIVGDATAGGWSNPVPTPSQQFTQIDAVSFGIITNLSSSGSYLFLPLNGDWTHKYGGASATGGVLLADGAVPGSNTPGPANSGLYEIVVNFATNSYTVTPYTGPPLPSNLYIVGDATAGGWNNPVPVPSQQFTQLSNAEFKITLPLSSTGSYLFLPLNGDWTNKFGGSSATGGALLYDGAVPSTNTPGPATSGTYTVDVNFITGAYTVQ